MKLRILGAFVALILPAFAETDGNYLVRYASSGPGTTDTIVNVVNTGSTLGITVPVNLAAYSGTSGVGTISGGSVVTPFTGSVTSTFGNICANVYVIDAADEQEVECCSCFLTPDQAVHFSAAADLTANTLTGRVPGTGIVIKIIATLPVEILNPSLSEPVATLINPVAELPSGPVFSSSQGTVGVNTFPCNPATVNQVSFVGGYQAGTGVSNGTGNGLFVGQPLVPTGLVAWARGNGTETGFANAQLTMSGNTGGELGRLVGLCSNIASNGSGFGICPTLCHYGAL